MEDTDLFVTTIKKTHLTGETIANVGVDGIVDDNNVSYYKLFIEGGKELNHTKQYKYVSESNSGDVHATSSSENPHYKIVKIIQDDDGVIQSCNVCENAIVREQDIA